MDRTAENPKEIVIELISDEMKQIQDKLKEIKAQVDQTQLVVDREQQRNADLAAELRTIHDNLDTVPREDIRSKYDEALDARFRLATMRGQLEKFEAIRLQLEGSQTLMAQLLKHLEGVDVLPGAEDGMISPAKTAGAANIVRIVQAQEDERQRLARQMHDGPAQSLTNFILQAEICQRLFNRDPGRAEQELDNLKTVASATFQKVRDFIFDLRPMMLDDLGVVPTVRSYVDNFRDKNDMQVKLDILGEERRLETHREVMLFRGIQELMGHARDYATAGELNIRLDMSGDRIKVAVEDNGRGFDAEAAMLNADNVSDSRAQSIITLKEKFELVGGGLAINSSETEGTVVHLELPSHD